MRLCRKFDQLCGMRQAAAVERGGRLLIGYGWVDVGFLIVGIPLVAAVMLLSYLTNKLDLKLVEFSESTD